MRKVCVFTGTRAEYGLLRPLMEALRKDANIRLQVIASGMHLSPEFGLTVREIEKDGFEIQEKVEILLSSDSPVGLCKSMGLGLIGFSEALERLKPDVLVILGDRFEAFAVASSAMICRIPIAHIHGGEATEGLIDEPIRHAVTKMSHLHFTSTERYRQRVIQLGESPDRVFNVGALGLDNIAGMDLPGRTELEEKIGLSLQGDYALITFHPVTLEKNTAQGQFQEILDALSSRKDLRLVFTKANADTEGRIINRMIDRYCAEHPERAKGFTSLGQFLYRSAMKHAAVVVGNSSSGIIEAPSFHVPTIDIGDRQKGRIATRSIIRCRPVEKEITEALDKALSNDFRETARRAQNPYEKLGTTQTIKDVLVRFELKNILKKSFYDLANNAVENDGEPL